MDPWVVRVKDSSCSPFWVRNYSRVPEKSNSWNSGNAGLLEIRVFKRKLASYSSSSSRGCHPLVITAMAKKNSHGNGDESIPEDGSRGSNTPSDHNAFQKSHHVNLDWREFRAKMVIQEQAHTADVDAANQAGSTLDSKPLGPKWAHPISIPETGCVLVATEKLDGVRTFERTVVLLLRSGTRHPQEGPFGVVINRPLNKKIKHMKPNNNELATTFADCSLHFGGPLDASMFLLKTGDEKAKLPGFEEVVPGLCFGARSSLDEAAALVKKGVLKPRDFRFFVGYAGWQLDQLRDEIESEYWYVASCSSNLIRGGLLESSESLWEEILQLMGGEYSELSRKPKQDM